METFAEITTFRVRKATLSFQFLSDLSFKGSIVNRASPSLNRDSLKLKLTVPLNMFFFSPLPDGKEQVVQTVKQPLQLYGEGIRTVNLSVMPVVYTSNYIM